MLSVQSDIAKAMLKLRSITEAQQFRFAVAKALTQTAQDVQTEVRKNMPERFTLRRQWIVQGIRITAAKKEDLTAVVYSKDLFMGRQETGEMKFPKYDQHLAIPLRAVRRTPKDLIKAADLPSALGKQRIEVIGKGGKKREIKGAGGSVFKITSKGKLFLCRRRGKEMELMYLLVPYARMKKRLGLQNDGERIARAKFAPNLQSALEDALRTAR